MTKQDIILEFVDKRPADYIEPERPQEKIDGLRITRVSFQEFSRWDFIPPATFFIKNAMGEFVFVHTRDRAKAQAAIDSEYGVGRYTVNASKMQKGKGEVTVRGTATRKGQKKY